MSLKRASTESAPEYAHGTLGAVIHAPGDGPVEPEAHFVALVQAMATGDQFALHELYSRAHRLVFTLVMRITNNRETAEELTLDVFHDVWRDAASYDPSGGSVIGWMLNRARSRAIDRVRFEGRQKRLVPGEEDWRLWTTPPESEDAVTLGQRRERLRHALTSLTPDERSAIEIAYFSELTYGEVASHLKQPLGTVKTRIRSGLVKLREALAGKERP